MKKVKLCPECGRELMRAYDYHCTTCDGPLRAGRNGQGPPKEKPKPEWVQALDRGREVSYPLAAAVWGCTLKEAIKRVNAMVRAGILRAGSGTGRFQWEQKEETL